MGLEQADGDIAPGLERGVALEQHPVCLADAGGHAEEHAEVSTPGG
jgi:hypothetical protein